MLASVFFWNVTLLASFHFCAVAASGVQLRGNGYENIVIAINPQVQENPQIISNIKDMISEASLYLFNVTKRRFYYREAKILIPSSWQSLNYQRPKHETYEKASIIVANQNLNNGNDPYTLHYKGCGKMGKYIHFSPDFLTDDTLLPIYGSRGRVFVHEWAHYRWGLFDEYNYETPFFVSVDDKIKPTRCSSEIAGMYICKKRSCSDGNCIIDPQTGNFEEGCMFLYNKTQKAKSSIMYMQALSSVVEFCDENSHDRESPNMQNKMCSYRSTWDVIKGSSDYRDTLPMTGNDLPPLPSFSLLQTGVRKICLVLDVSEHMSMIRRMQQAAAIFLLHIVATDSYVGIVTYNETAEVKSPLREIVNDDVRMNLTRHLPATSNGDASICKGIISALQVLKSPDGNTDGSEIILVASGEDRNLDSCFSDVSLGGAVIHTIAIGTKADSQLEYLSEMSGGDTFFASDNMESNSLINAFSEIPPRHGNIAQQLIKLGSVSRLTSAGGQLSGFVTIDRTLGNDTSFIITWQVSELLEVLIQDPAGNNYSTENLQYDLDLQVACLRVPGIAQDGTWTYNVINKANISQVFGMFVTSRPASEAIAQVIVHVDISTNTITFPNPVIIAAEVKQGFSAILGVNVTATIEPEFGNPFFLTLLDDGAGADVAKDDGVYSKYLFSFTQNGRFSVNVDVEWEDTATLIPVKISRSMYIPGYIENGTINMNPPRPLASEAESTIQSFRRTVTSGSGSVTNVSHQTTTDMFPPCRITDLDAKMENGYVWLSWTAPGDNYDQGTVSRYEMRMSSSPMDLRENFFSAAVINASTLKPQNAGNREIFSFAPPNNIVTENGSITYIAICAIDKASLHSEISNLVQVVKLAYSKNINFVNSEEVARFNIPAVIVIVVSLVCVCLVLGASVYAFKNGKLCRLHRQKPENQNNISKSKMQGIDSTKEEVRLPILSENNTPGKIIADIEVDHEV
ncbi:calcium-activated chloride channel regulator 1-like [Bombina bombina]|uniref:calcium-activated chloride channel regulator 1-like n=1 Tax=Bombina bombina TaxID=8345 RepID=UPI00235ABC7E|nr:calcium-activated chloride channel regulator 1-like [Bombina bombina]